MNVDIRNESSALYTATLVMARRMVDIDVL